MEEWKDIKEFEGLYQISNLGNVKSLGRKVRMFHQRSKKYIEYEIKEKLLRPIKDSYGYPFVNLCKDGKICPKKIHRLIAEAFIPNPEDKPFVDHIDTDRSNFKIENLRWVNQIENMNNATTREKIRKMPKYMSQFFKKS